MFEDENVNQKNNYLTSGQMAKMCFSSEKALRIYQDKGILNPVYINPENGYRHYSLSQCSTVDMIRQLQTIGFTLDEIKLLMETKDPEFYQAETLKQLERIENESYQLAISKATAEGFLNSCKNFIHKPICNQIQLEYIPDRHILVFDSEPVDAKQQSLEFLWEEYWKSAREMAVKKGYPLSLCCNMGSFIPEENIKNGSFIFGKAFVFVEDSFGTYFDDAVILPGGQYLTMYSEHCVDFNTDSYNLEYKLIIRMLDYAAAKGFEVNGDYFDEAVAQTPAFDYTGRDGFFKLCLPVKRSAE